MGEAVELLARARRLANPSQLIQALRWYAETRTSDESQDAIHALEECLAHSRAVATPDGADVLQAFGLLSKLRAETGEDTAAIEALRQAVAGGHDTGQRFTLFSLILNNGVSVAADLQAPVFAATLGGALTGGPLREQITVAPALFSDRQAVLGRVRAQLGPAAYEAAAARGATLSYEETIDYTLGELDRLRAESNPSQRD